MFDLNLGGLRNVAWGCEPPPQKCVYFVQNMKM